MFGKIRYTDGSYFPIYLYGESGDHNEFKTDCALIPSQEKEIELIDISFGLETENIDNPINFWSRLWRKKRHIFITDAHFDMYPNIKKHKCDRINYIKPFPKHEIKTHYKKKLKEFVKSKIQIYIFFIKPHNDLTICLQISIERLVLIPHHVKQFPGPFSISIYIKDPNEIKQVDEIWESNSKIRDQCSFHLVFRLPQTYDSPVIHNKMLNYPVNLLRNIARKYAKTEFILYLDADFLVSENLHKRTTNGKIE